MSNPRPISSPDTSRSDGRLRTLYIVNELLRQVVSGGLEMGEILPGVLRVALAELQAATGSIIVVDEELRVQHAWLIDDEGSEESTSPFLKEVVEKGLFAWATRQKETIVVADTRDDERWLPRPGHPTAIDPWSAVCTPLIVRGRPIGALTMTRQGRDQFTRREVELLEAIAGQAATTIESARLYRESQQRATVLSALISATAAVSTSLDREEVLRGVAEQMTRLLFVDLCLIYDWDEDSQTLSPRLLFSQNRDVTGAGADEALSFSAERIAVVQALLEEGDPLQLQPGHPLLTPQENSRLAEVGIHALLLLPLITPERPVGLLVLLDLKEARDFSPQEVDVARMMANHAAIAVHNARLYEDTQRQLRVSALLNEASKVINSTLDTDQILQSLLAQMNELLNAEAISIALVDPQRDELVYTVAEGLGSAEIVGLRLPSNQGVSGWVMKHGQPALVPDMARDARFYAEGDRRTGQTTRAMICAPLQVKGEVLGTIQAINPKKGPFTGNDLQLLVNLANLASSALNNAQQYARTLAAEERYLSLFEDSINPILLTGFDGRIVEANRRAVEFLGYSHGELLSLPVASLHVAGDEHADLPELETIPASRACTFQSVVVDKDGETTPVETYVKRTKSAGTEVLQWIYRDITQEVELEEMRTDLMAMLVHDLQSPLSNVISSLELLRYELPPEGDDITNSIVDIAVRSSNRLQTLIRSLLDISHLEAGRPVADLNFAELPQLVEEAFEQVQPVFNRRQAALTADYPDELPPVYVDADMIRRVIVNLLDNASKYSPEGFPVAVAVAPPDSSGFIQVAVSDQGSGIPARHRDAVFEKFRRIQGEGAPKGMGLGLAFCRLAVEAHGGRIWVDDVPEGGARFNFTLPTKARTTARPG
ncbi:MAG: GAF domain-containing protein [Anaerolineae bacterium]|nr:GAF domain-containing protein [Anaerolineae bacterium]